MKPLQALSSSQPGIGISARLDELRALQPGWLDGEGVALPRAGLRWLETELTRRCSGELAPPKIFPTPAEGVQLEWETNADDTTLTIDLQERTGWWHALSFESDEDESRSLDLSSDAGWGWVTMRRRQSRQLN